MKMLKSAILGAMIALLLLLIFPHLRPKEWTFLTGEAPLSYHYAVKKASPSVVNLYNLSQSHQTEAFYPLGSGIIMDREGYVITNLHVIDGAESLVVALQDGRRFNALLLGQDRVTDIALLKVDAQNLPAISYDLARPSRVGDVVLAIGNPYNIGQTVTQGIISALGRNSISESRRQAFIQTDASINHGNSGGALVNTLGELVGLNTLTFSKLEYKNQVPEGIGFAIPIEVVVKVMRTLIEKGQVQRGYIGIEGIEFNPAPTSALAQKGVLITQVYEPAKSAGLQSGDILLAIDHVPIQSMTEALTQIADLKPSDKIELTYFRNGAEKSTWIEVKALNY